MKYITNLFSHFKNILKSLIKIIKTLMIKINPKLKLKIIKLINQFNKIFEIRKFIFLENNSRISQSFIFLYIIFRNIQVFLAHNSEKAYIFCYGFAFKI